VGIGPGAQCCPRLFSVLPLFLSLSLFLSSFFVVLSVGWHHGWWSRLKEHVYTWQSSSSAAAGRL